MQNIDYTGLQKKILFFCHKYTKVGELNSISLRWIQICS
jgi:hypothetical protein